MKTLVLFVASVIITLSTAFAQVPDNAGTINGNSSVCANNTATYSTSVINNATSYMWVIPNGATLINGFGTNVVVIQFGITGGDVLVFGQNGNQLGNPSSLTVAVNQAPSVTVVANPTDVCVGTSTTLTANTNASSFLWTGGSTNQNIQVTPSANTTYNVTVTGGNGCTSTSNVTVNVHALPNVSLNLTEDHVCTDIHNVVLAGGSPATGTYSSDNPNVVFGGNTVYPAITNTGTFTIKYSVTDMYGCTGSATDMMTVNPVPQVMFNNITGSLTTSSPKVDLNNFVMPQNGTFTGKGVKAGSSIFDFAEAGVGTHMLTYTYVHPITGCSASQIQYVTIAGNINGVAEVTTAANNINIFPNPTTTDLNLQGINTKEIKALKIINLIGDVVFSTEVNESEMRINTTDYPSGVYIISFIDADGLSVGKRFVKN